MTDHRDTVLVDVILTTTAPIAAYGGMQLTREILEDLVSAILAQRIPMQFRHDMRRPAKARAVEAGVRPRADGYEEAWAVLEFDRAQWYEFEAERMALGGPGGMSFSMVRTIGEFETAQDLPEAVVAADAHHYPDDVIIEAASALKSLARVKVGRYYQFGLESWPKVVLELGYPLVQSVPIGVLTNYLYDVIRPFLRVQKADPTVFEFELYRDERGTKLRAHLQTSSEAVAFEAIRQLGAWAEEPPLTIDYDLEAGEWREFDED